MLLKIKDNIKKHVLLKDNLTVIVGFSGGADSALLVYALKELGYKTYAVHVEHGIRGDEGRRDAQFAKEFCQKHEVEFFIEHIDVPAIAKTKRISLETAAREERYGILRKYSKLFNAPIAVAHNKNDQAETVLMHLLRGCGLNGLCGMKFKNGDIIRPLLNVSREEIERFNLANGIDYITDSTNLSLDYTRNKIRLEILPALSSVSGGDAVSSVFSCSEKLSEYRKFIDEATAFYAEKVLDKKNNCIIMKINDEIPRIIKIELIKEALFRLNGHIVDIESVHLDDILALMSKESGKELCLPYDTKVKKSYGSLIFFSVTDKFSVNYCFEVENEYIWHDGVVKSIFTDFAKYEKDCEYLDFEKLPTKLMLRTRQSGDYIYPLGSVGKCTLKKYFIDKKIPANIRNTIPLLACDSEVFAIIGYTVSEKTKITDTTNKILKVYKEHI